MKFMKNKNRDVPNYDKAMWISLLLAFLTRFLPDSVKFYIPFIITLIILILMIRYIICKGSIIIIGACFVLILFMGIISAINLINGIYIEYLSIVPMLWKICAGIFILSINYICIFLIKVKSNRAGIIAGAILLNLITIAFMIFI